MFRQTDPGYTVVNNNNHGEVALARSPIHHNVSNHIEVRYHFFWEYVACRKLNLENSTSDNRLIVSRVCTLGRLSALAVFAEVKLRVLKFWDVAEWRESP